MQLEVIANDCRGLYLGQPNCTEVVGTLGALGFKPASPVYCDPRLKMSRSVTHHWTGTAWGCELEVVFMREDVDLLPPSIRRMHSVSRAGYENVEPIVTMSKLDVGQHGPYNSQCQKLGFSKWLSIKGARKC